MNTGDKQWLIDSIEELILKRCPLANEPAEDFLDEDIYEAVIDLIDRIECVIENRERANSVDGKNEIIIEIQMDRAKEDL